MTNQITQKFIDLLGPITDGRMHFATYSSSTTVGGHTVAEMSKVQRQLAEGILKEHFHFKEVKWITHTGGAGEPVKAFQTSTHKLLDEGRTYEGKTAYVYQIMFSSKMYDPTTFMKQPVKDGCTFGPLVYNPETFEPSRTIVLTFNPTYPQDLTNTIDEENLMKQSLHDKLEKVLTNPEDYMPEGSRVCMIRMTIKWI
jgi:hypothetical protein